MPNHITTVCTITGQDARVQAFRKAHITTNSKGGAQFDFETIIPMPGCVKATIIDGHLGKGFGDADVSLYAKALLMQKRTYILSEERRIGRIPEHILQWKDLLEWYDREKPAAVGKLARASLVSAAETGHYGWYEWSIANWGTKWDAYSYEERDTSPGRFEFKFETAWSMPEPIFNKLAELWPDLRLDTESIDEGGGEYIGAFHGSKCRVVQVLDDDERYERVYGRVREADDD